MEDITELLEMIDKLIEEANLLGVASEPLNELIQYASAHRVLH